MKTPNEKQLREMIPDYISGSLSTKETAFFEAQLSINPGLQKELQALAPLFMNLARLDYKSIQQEKAQFVTAAVLTKLAQKKERKRKAINTPLIRFAVPIAAMILIAFLIGQPFADKKMQRNINISAATNEIVATTAPDTLLIIDDVAITQEFIDDYADYYGGSIAEYDEPLIDFDYEALESALSENIADDIALAFAEVDMPSELIHDAGNTLFDNCLLRDDELFDENDLEFVLEVMENVTIL